MLEVVTEGRQQWLPKRLRGDPEQEAGLVQSLSRAGKVGGQQVAEGGTPKLQGSLGENQPS